MKTSQKKADAPALSQRETDALRIARELAREASHAPRKAPRSPQRTNRYIAPQ